MNYVELCQLIPMWFRQRSPINNVKNKTDYNPGPHPVTTVQMPMLKRLLQIQVYVFQTKSRLIVKGGSDQKNPRPAATPAAKQGANAAAPVARLPAAPVLVEVDPSRPVPLPLVEPDCVLFADADADADVSTAELTTLATLVVLAMLIMLAILVALAMLAMLVVAGAAAVVVMLPPDAVEVPPTPLRPPVATGTETACPSVLGSINEGEYVSVPSYRGHPGTVVLGGALPPPQSSSLHTSPESGTYQSRVAYAACWLGLMTES